MERRSSFGFFFLSQVLQWKEDLPLVFFSFLKFCNGKKIFLWLFFPFPSFAIERRSSFSCFEPILKQIRMRLFNDIRNSPIQWVLTLQLLFEDLKVHHDSNSQNDSSFESVNVFILSHSFTLSTSREHEM